MYHMSEDDVMDKIVTLLNKVPEVVHWKKDLNATLEDACELSIAPLDHEYSKFGGLDKLDTVEGLDDLDGFDVLLTKQALCGLDGDMDKTVSLLNEVPVQGKVRQVQKLGRARHGRP